MGPNLRIGIELDHDVRAGVHHSPVKVQVVQLDHVVSLIWWHVGSIIFSRGELPVDKRADSIVGERTVVPERNGMK